MEPVQTRRLKLLLVDDEEQLLWSLNQRVQKERPAWSIDTANDGVSALERLRAVRYDGLVVDMRMPGMSGVEVVLTARLEQPDLPIVIMTAYPTNEVLQELRANGAIGYLEKPFEFARFLEVLEKALASRGPGGFTGSILVQTLPDVVQLYVLSQATGALRVVCDGRTGTIWFERGSIPHAETARAKGIAAFHEIMTWSGGNFSMQLGATVCERTITIGWMELVLESCRVLDEAAAESTEAIPTKGWTLVPPPADDGAPPPSLPEPQTTPVLAANPNTASGEIPMANIKDSLSKLDTIDGFIGACLVDSDSGMVLGTEGGGPLNLEVAGAGNTEVVRAKRKAAKSLNLKDDIEDILITLGKQYHLIRPLKAKPQIFFYLALDRGRANLAMARMTLADVEKDLQM